MDSITIVTSNLTNSLVKTISKLLHFPRRRRHQLCSNQDNHDKKTHKLKPSKVITIENPKPNVEKPEDADADADAVLLESLIANLFTTISAIKVSYLQLQAAESPYDPKTVQTVDLSVVEHLRHLSEMKRAFFQSRSDPLPSPTSSTVHVQIKEHSNLIQTYQTTTKKLESEIQLKDSEIASLQSQLVESNRENQSLEQVLDQFLDAVSCTVRSISCFVELLMREMESAGWDVVAAAEAIQPDVKINPVQARVFAFESFVCQKLFSNFHRRDFGLQEGETWRAQSQFTDEFLRLKSVKKRQLKSTRFGDFCRAKYLELVHPKMELAFFSDVKQREIVSRGSGVPESEFYQGFAEMATSVWLLHCLFFSFEEEMAGSIFQVKRGERFSEVYMENAREEDGGGGGRMLTVGFTVMPGFRIGKTVIRCKVYLSG